jgi:hypothetical protein
MTDRRSWKDCRQAADNMADAARAVGYPMPPETWQLAVAKGSVTNGHSGELYWVSHEPIIGTVPIPGGSKLPWSPNDAYNHLTAITTAYRDLAFQQRAAKR